MRGKRYFRCCALWLTLAMLPGWAVDVPGTGWDAGQTVLYRDSWGVPHIYAPTAEEGLYAMGYAQAQDRPDQLLESLARAMGESAKFDGARGVPSDMRAHLFDIYGAAQRNYGNISETAQAHLRAFVKGINDFYAAYPEDKPAWWGADRPVEEAMVIAFGRLFLYNWSIDDAYSDLRRGGVQPGADREERGSNQFAVSPRRSAENAAILYIDPHLSWWGPSRFWEVRIHAGELVGSGFTLPGQPNIGLGHNAHVAWAMTTGGPDTADVYELTLNEENPLQYRYDEEWRDITTREVTIAVKDGDAQQVTLYYSHLGPIIAQRGGKAYAAAMAYQEVVELNDTWYGINIAQDYQGIQEALSQLAMFPQNIMVADTSGNIYYQRTGRVPVRPEGYDWSRPVPGDTSKTAWKGLHPTSELVQLLNPEQGYMQNCNIPPDQMIVNSPLTPDKFKDYIFGDLGYGPRGGWSNQRGARAIALLDADDSVTIEEALAYATDLHPYGVDRWIDALRSAHERFGEQFAAREGYSEAIADLLAWDQRLAPDSTGALKYYYWREQLVLDHGQDIVRDVARGIDQHHLIAQGKAPEPVQLSEDEMQAALDSLARSTGSLREHFGSLDAKWGDKFRVGRDEMSWPVGGGGGDRQGITTLRNVGYGSERPDHTRWGQSGQTSTQIVVMTQPVQSWTNVPIGQSDRPNSPHYADQAEKLFSPGILKETWWTPEALHANVASRQVLTGAAALVAAPEGAPVQGDPAAVAGTWTLTLTYQGTNLPATLALQEVEGTLQGQWKDQFGDDTLAEITFEDDTLRFKRDVRVQGQVYGIRFEGKVAANALNGAFQTEIGALGVSGSRAAAPDAADEVAEAPAPESAPPAPAPVASAFAEVAGVWNLSMAFQGRDTPATMTLREEDGTLKGTWNDIFGEDELFRLSYESGTLQFNREVTYQGQEYEISFEGAVDANAITGQFFTAAGILDVAGTREAAPEPPAEAPAPPAEDPEPVLAPDDFTGIWEATIRFEGMETPSQMILSKTEDEYAVAVEDTYGDSPGYDVQLEGNELRFRRQVTYQGTQYVITFRGAFEGEEIQGRYDTDAGALPVSGRRLQASSSRKAPHGSPTGVWEVVIDVQGNPLPARLVISQDAEGNLEGTWEDQLGTNPPRNIAFDRGVLTFERTVEYQGQDYELRFEGVVAGDSLEGDFHTDIGPLPVTGQRVQENVDAVEETATAVPGELEPFTGVWNVTLDFQGQAFPATLTLQLDENGALEGAWSDQYSETPPRNIQVTGNALSFERTIEYQGQDYVIGFEGTLQDGMLTGQFNTDMGPLPLSAQRADVTAEVVTDAGAESAAQEPFLGDWDIVVDLQGSDLPARMSVHRGADGQLIATWTDEHSTSAPFNVRIEGNMLRFDRRIDFQAQEYVIAFEGVVENGELEGRYDTDMGPLALRGTRAATPATSNGSLSGTWEVTTVSQIGTVVRTLKISPDFSGWYGTEERRFPLRNLRQDGSQVSFEVTVEIQDTEIPLAFDGSLEQGAMKGVFASPYGNATMSAVRLE